MIKKLQTSKHTASVVVINETGRPVGSVSLLYQYGENAIERQTWSCVYPNEMCSSIMKIQYEYGPKMLTSDQKWLLSWYSSDFKTLQSTCDQLKLDIAEMHNIGSSRTELNKQLYQLPDGCNSLDRSSGMLTLAAETPTNAIMEGKQSQSLMKSTFRLSHQDDMKEHAMIYFVIREDRKVLLTCRTGRQLFDVSQYNMTSRGVLH